ncbi:2-dehydropantoate 2-reductase [Acrocarpospora corrugata]|uniref:2-dehydropantoate 2-reductase n=1 Tax=Acrocarpospora corrugata TaxID=35763 RepID=A0A5M3W3H5_9ACTN|nr:ketopantoate reductase family protein [Acrocarpospora corrugata]GES02582.1 2-dehydropantoate 2-reductase [Acrocarpospora corrugata]
MRTLVVGAGATGGYFGGRLVQAGRDVTFLVRSGRARVLRERGLRIVGLGETTTLNPRTILTGEITSPFDLILLSVKATGLRGAMEALAPAVGPRTLILPVLNGLRHIDDLAERFGERAVLGGVAKLSTTVDADGYFVRLADLQGLTYGARTAPTPELAEAHRALSGAGFDSRLSDDILGEMWVKWVFIAATGAVTCLMRGTVGEVASVPGGVEFAEAVVAECAAIADAAGHAVPKEEFENTRDTVTAPGSAFSSSLYRDLVSGQAVEAEHIFGDLVLRARRLGVEVPLMDLVTLHLRVYQGRPETSRRPTAPSHDRRPTDHQSHRVREGSGTRVRRGPAGGNLA